MKAQIITAVAILAAAVSLESPVRAQSVVAPSIAEESYTITGDFLEGIGTRTSESDFMKFFEEPKNNGISNNNQERKSSSNAPARRSNRSISLPADYIFLQPVQARDIYGIDGNYGLEIQFRTEN